MFSHVMTLSGTEMHRKSEHIRLAGLIECGLHIIQADLSRRRLPLSNSIDSIVFVCVCSAELQQTIMFVLE